MNRNNIWIHVGIAAVLITIAAVLGQIDRIRTSVKDDAIVKKRVVDVEKINHPRPPEVLVRFKKTVSMETIREVLFRNHDILSDEIESVSGLTVIDDLDDADAEEIVSQYQSLADLVDYAEVNPVINFDDPTQVGISARSCFSRICRPASKRPAIWRPMGAQQSGAGRRQGTSGH